MAGSYNTFAAPPAANADYKTTAEDFPIAFNPLINDWDPDNDIDPSSVKIILSPLNGLASVNLTNGHITYVPSLNFYGYDTLQYEVCDLTGSCSSAYIYMTITSVNDPPVANADTVSIPENTSVTISPLSNDTDPENNINPASLNVIFGPFHGSYTINSSTGEITYAPDANYNGSDNIKYFIADSGGAVASNLIYITVTPVNRPPITKSDYVVINEDSPSITASPLTNDQDSDSNIDTSTLIISGPSNGIAAINGGIVTYTSNPNFNGLDTIYYTICDLGGLCASDTIFITVNPVNDAPTVNSDTVYVNENSSVIIDELNNDTDSENNINPSSVIIMQGPVHGTTIIDPLTGQITYEPDINYNGNDAIHYAVGDSIGLFGNNIIFIVVTPVNYAPITKTDYTTVNEDNSSVTGSPLGNDTDPDNNIDSSSLSIIGPSNGIAVVVSGGYITYAPNPNFNGTDTIYYTICDLGGLCASDTIIITINPINDAPITNSDTVYISENTLTTLYPLLNDIDIESSLDTSTLTIVLKAQNGKAQADTGVINYLPNPDYIGRDTIVYAVCDLGLPLPVKCSMDTIFIVVIPGNSYPRANVDSIITNEDTPVDIYPLANDTDPNNNIDQASLVITAGPMHGAATYDALTGIITYKPDPNFHGWDGFIYKINDTGSPVLYSYDTVFIQVLSVNDAPIANADTLIITEDTAFVAINPTMNDSDPDFNAIFISVIGSPTNGIFNLIGTNIIYTPFPNFYGNDTIIYQLCDLGTPSLCTIDTLFITVLSINDAPFSKSISITVAEDGIVQGSLFNIVSDVENNMDTASYVLLSGPLNGNASFDVATGIFSYEPNADFYGSDTLVYQICDAEIPSLCTINTIYITVLPVNDAPVILDAPGGTPMDTLFISISEDMSVNTCLDVIDVDFNLVDVVAGVSYTGNAIVTVAPTGDTCFTYTPYPNFNGLDLAGVLVCDGKAGCDTLYVIVQVNPVNDAPIAVDDAGNVLPNATITIDAQLNDIEVDGNPLTTTYATANNGSVVILNGDSLSYTPNPEFCGVDTITYTVCDVLGLCDQAIIVINVSYPDEDGDKIPDNVETVALDHDNDGTLNYLDIDSDNDGIPDAVEGGVADICVPAVIIDTDNDTKFDYLDSDSDADGIPDYYEAMGINSKPIDNDADGDGIDDVFDSDQGGVGLAYNPIDTDSDGLPDYRDPDSDGDTKLDIYEGTADCDDDGIPNYMDNDDECTMLTLPEAYSPNGDGVNDKFELVGIEAYAENEIIIFNRWGSEVYRKKGYANDWDGKASNAMGIITEEELPAGSYFYILKLGPGFETLKGHVYLQR